MIDGLVDPSYREYLGGLDSKEMKWAKNLELNQNRMKLTGLACGDGIEVIEDMRVELLRRLNMGGDPDPVAERAQGAIDARLQLCPIEAL
jgi:hypothetical protein